MSDARRQTIITNHGHGAGPQSRRPHHRTDRRAVSGDGLNGLTGSCATTRVSTGASATKRSQPAGRQAALTGELAVCAGSCGPGSCIDQRPLRLPAHARAGIGVAAHIPSARSDGTILRQTEELFGGAAITGTRFHPSQLPGVLGPRSAAIRASRGGNRHPRRRCCSYDAPSRRPRPRYPPAGSRLLADQLDAPPTAQWRSPHHAVVPADARARTCNCSSSAKCCSRPCARAGRQGTCRMG